MLALSTRTAITTTVIVIGVATIVAALAQSLNGYERSADGLTAYLGVTPAAVVKGRQTMHGGAPNSPHEYHIDAAIFDNIDATRISDAKVTIKVLGMGVLGQEARLASMNAADARTYGGFFYLPGVDIYAIRLTIERTGSRQPVILDFNYDHRHQ